MKHRGSCRVFYEEGVCTCGADPAMMDDAQAIQTLREARDVLIEAYWTPDDIAAWDAALSVVEAQLAELRLALATVPERYEHLHDDYRAMLARADELRNALTLVRDWIRDGKGTEAEVAEAMDAAQASRCTPPQARPPGGPR